MMIRSLLLRWLRLQDVGGVLVFNRFAHGHTTRVETLSPFFFLIFSRSVAVIVSFRCDSQLGTILWYQSAYCCTTVQ